jgi:molecular chaperone DnaJ
VDTGSQLRLRGEGEPGEKGGAPGDLFVVIHVKDHDFFRREDEELFCQIPISFVQAALGDSITIPVLGDEGHFQLKISEGTQPGDIIRVPEQGMPSIRRQHKRGNLYVKVLVNIPKKLSQSQKDLLKAFAETEGSARSGKRKKGGNLWDKLKK